MDVFKLKPGESTVLIAGAGVAGCGLALQLVQKGIKVQLFERKERDKIEGSSMGIHPPSQRVLDRLGLLEKTLKVGASKKTLHHLTATNGFIGTTDLSTEDYTTIHLLRPPFLKILRDAVEASPLAKTHYGANVVDVEDLGEVVRFVFEDDGKSASGDIAIAADGLHSRLRRKHFTAERPTYAGRCALIHYIKPSELDPFPNNSFIYSNRGVFITFQLNGEQSVFAVDFSIEGDRSGSEWTALHESGQVIDQVKEFWAGYPEPIASILASATPQNTTLWPYFDIPHLDSWHKGRVVLLGDVAHGLPPPMGQGAAMALESGHLLCRALVEGAPLSAWERERRKRIEHIRTLTTRVLKARAWICKGPWWVFWLKSWTLWFVMRQPALTKDMHGMYYYDGEKVKLD